MQASCHYILLQSWQDQETNHHTKYAAWLSTKLDSHLPAQLIAIATVSLSRFPSSQYQRNYASISLEELIMKMTLEIMCLNAAVSGKTQLHYSRSQLLHVCMTHGVEPAAVGGKKDSRFSTARRERFLNPRIFAKLKRRLAGVTNAIRIKPAREQFITKSLTTIATFSTATGWRGRRVLFYRHEARQQGCKDMLDQTTG